MRAMLYEPEMRLNGGAIMAYDPCATDASEASLLSSVLSLYRSGVLPGALDHIAEEQVSNRQVAPLHMLPCQHLASFRRAAWPLNTHLFLVVTSTHSQSTPQLTLRP